MTSEGHLNAVCRYFSAIVEGVVPPWLRKHFSSLPGVSRYRLVSSYVITGSFTKNKRPLAGATSKLRRCTESAVCVVNADADDFSVFSGVANPHRLAADKTVLDVILRRYG